MVRHPEPRWGTQRSDASTLGGELWETAALFEIDLFSWQGYVADVALEIDETGRYRYRVVGVGVGRQNGKTLLAAIRIAHELRNPGHRVGFTAQDRNLAREKWDEHCELIANSELRHGIKRQIRGSGREELEMTNGAKYGIFTPSGKGARGKTLDLVMIDEALTHDMSLIQAVEPTMATRPNGQLWLLSNAGDAGSTLLAHYRRLGHHVADNPDDNAARLAWFEWAPLADRFDPNDPDVWAEAIPTLGEEMGVVPEAVAQAAASQPGDVFAREWLNVWPALSATQVIDPDAWAACAAPDLAMPPGGTVFGLDVSPDRDSAAIVACGVTAGRYCVEIVDHRPGVGWVHDRLVELHRKWRAQVVINGATSAAGALIPDLEQDGVQVVIAKARDYVDACGMFYDRVEGHDLAHRSDPVLDDAVAAATKRTVGEAWAWQKRSSIDITPLVAGTLAVWGAVTVRTPTPAIH